MMIESRHTKFAINLTTRNMVSFQLLERHRKIQNANLNQPLLHITGIYASSIGRSLSKSISKSI